VQWILEISEADVPETAQRLANSLTQIVQGEPLGATADVQLILSVVVWTEKLSGVSAYGTKLAI
jgi:hypothetical protein